MVVAAYFRLVLFLCPKDARHAHLANRRRQHGQQPPLVGRVHRLAYIVEVPVNWNGKLFMYAHGYAGTG